MHERVKTLTVFGIRIYLDNCSVICTVTLGYVLRQTNSEFWFNQKLCLFGYIRAYSVPCITHAYSQPYHIPSPGI